ncbi:MAG: valine--tRNA ligase [archaeon]
MTNNQDKQQKKGYNFSEAEPRIQDFWEKEKIYKFDTQKTKSFSIDTPPPTVSGKMHIGHSFSYAQQDFIARFHRMNKGVFYPFGTDDNGLPTERLVEKLKNVKSKEMSRADFIDLCLKTIKEITPEFIEDWKRLGISADYEIAYSTIDEKSRKLSQKMFLELYKAGQIYKKEFPTIWCPECQTAIAQAELEDKELPSKFSTIKFRLKESGKDLLIATTRPELIPACVAIFINPKDKRAKGLVGKTVLTPLFNEEVKIFADESANQEKGTGMLMVCSYGDKFDVEAIKKLKLEPKIVLNKDGTHLSEGYVGLRIKKARNKILEDLEKNNLIEKSEDIKHIVNVHERCGTEIEFLPTPQWFIKILDKKEILINRAREINWHPQFMFKRYENWVNGLEWDWNISRNRHFGIPIPVWECENCKEIILPKESELPIDPIQTKKNCPKCKCEATPETMVLDTWATSSISPQILSSLVDGKIKIPFSLRPQGHDIIRTWAFYTIVRSHLHENKIPWKDIMVSGNVSLKGEKMSKSKGNVIDPKTVIEEFGSDALRYWAASSTIGSDIDYQEQDLIAGKKTVTKLWNASNFVFMNLEDFDGKKPKKFEKIDERFLIELNRVLTTATYRYENYEYSRARLNIDEFFWKFFCDHYLEIVKKRIYNETGDKKKSAQYVLYQSLLAIIKMYAPILPFVTEEIYQTYFKETEKEKSIHLTTWPEYDKKFKGWDDKNIKSHANELTLFIDLLSRVRAEKTSAQKPMNSECILTIDNTNYGDLKEALEDLAAVTNAKEIKQGKFKVEFT